MAEKLTVLVPTFNEEEMLRACLESVKWADELFVVDSFSTDRTLEIAAEFGARTIQHEYVNSATQKNWAIPQAKNEWILVIDSDERATPALIEEVKALMAAGPDADAYRIPRRSFFFGREIRHCGWESDKVTRLFRRDARYLDREVHADIDVSGMKLGEVSGIFEHHTVRSFDQYFEKFGRYTTWAANDLRKRGRRAGLLSLTARPAARFFKMYILRLGFLDGLHGLVLCWLATMSVFMKYARLWSMQLGGAPSPDAASDAKPAQADVAAASEDDRPGEPAE